MTEIERIILSVVQKKITSGKSDFGWINFYFKKEACRISHKYICVTFFTKITAYNDSELECWLTCPEKMANKIQEKMNKTLNIDFKPYISNEATIILDLQEYPPLALLRKIVI